MTQLVSARIDDELVAAIDDLVTEGVVSNRSEAVRLGIEQLLDRHRRAKTGRAIADAYRRVPQRASESTWSDGATVAMIAEEPW